MFSKLTSSIFIVFFAFAAYANPVSPMRYDSNEFASLRAASDYGQDTFENHGFRKGQINDVYYNQVLWCSLNEIDGGATHSLAITKNGSGFQMYEYIDVSSEGYYKILSQAPVLVSKSTTTLEVSDNSGGKIIFNYQGTAKGYADIGLKNPALFVQGKVSCIASPL
jgi:hypothetical protein